MSLETFQDDLMRCSRCSYCKWIPHQVMTDTRFLTGCPSIERFQFHGWSAGGRVIAALSLLRGRTEITETFLDMVYQCQMCGACDVSCKGERDFEPYEYMQELRIHCVEQGEILPEHMEVIDGLRSDDNMLGEPKAERGDWAEGLPVKNLTEQKAEVLFHAGCRYSFDSTLRQTVRDALTLLLDAGVDVAVMGADENCCGGRSYEMGFAGEFVKYARHNVELWKASGVKTVVTPCADCFQAFRVLYEKAGHHVDVEIVHITELLDRLVKEGTIKLRNEVPMTVTYHDPCHLGRLADPWVSWEGERKKVEGQLLIHDPPKRKRCGALGVYDAPRELLRAIPGLTLVEMHRIREYGWCCGAGGGVLEAYPDFAAWSAAGRVDEARSVGAEALVTACGWCKHTLTTSDDAADGKPMNVVDIVDLVRKAV
jgi:Fe-S oxidoreductase